MRMLVCLAGKQIGMDWQSFVKWFRFYISVQCFNSENFKLKVSFFLMNHAGEDKYSIKTRNMFSVVGFQELSQFVLSVVEFVPSKGA